ncbi:hypothetical protein L6452_15034 [Arctium lappa]|uniref:Uncharacterized protein n=1 Tax=Arctium lappa TaxID=4217 RepID=A0ACB9CMG9_ARCLA|nr:hypothetical protein L6452_15034 [Arctium lappa]
MELTSVVKRPGGRGATGVGGFRRRERPRSMFTLISAKHKRREMFAGVDVLVGEEYEVVVGEEYEVVRVMFKPRGEEVGEPEMVAGV